ncbi:MAG: hypothetical protein ACYDHB_00955 [Candidatus Dormibacteria bacterium]
MRPELGAADLLGAASAWAAIHPGEAVEALTAIFEGVGIPEADARFETCRRAVNAALGREYRGLAALRQAEGPKAVSEAFRRASLTARYRQDLAEVAAAK